MGWTDKAVRRYVRDAGPLLDELNHLQRCDCTTRNQNAGARARAPDGRARGAHRRAARAGGARRHPPAARRPPGDGVPRRRSPGRVVGEALDFLLEVRLDEGPIGEADAYARLDAWARERGIDGHGGVAPTTAAAAASRRRQAPSLRARHTMVDGTRAPGVSGRGSSRVSTRKPARPSSVNTSPMSRRATRTGSPSRSTSIGPGSK